MVAKFITTLLKANKSQQEAFYALQVPRAVFKEGQAEIRWIYDYRDRHRSYPSLSTFKARFTSFKPVKSKDTVETSFQAILNQHLFEEVSDLVDKAKSMYAGGRDMSEVIGYMRKASQEISTFDTGYVDMNVRTSDSALKRYHQRVSERIHGGNKFNPTPWPSMNDLIGFSEYGEHNIIASRTSIGKTWLELNWAVHLAKQGERVVVFSKEMPTPQVGDRIECILFELPWPNFRKGTLPPRVLRAWKDARRRLKINSNLNYGRNNFIEFGDNIIVSGQETITGVGFSHIISKIQQYQPTVVFVDGAYLITPEGLNRNANGVERFTMISNTSKRLAIAFKTLWYSIIQINRLAENKTGESNPSLKDIYGADAWAQDADNVYLIGGKRGGKSRMLSLAKGRESNIGDISIKFELAPYPDFKEIKTIKSLSSGGSVEFDAI
jgi:replicative DNA helicase